MVIFFCCRGGQSVLFSSHYFFCLNLFWKPLIISIRYQGLITMKRVFNLDFFLLKSRLLGFVSFFSCMNKMTDLYFISFENFCVISWPKQRACTIFLVLRDIMIGDDDGKFVLCSFFSSKFYRKKNLTQKKFN